jgi:hypothetical protein
MQVALALCASAGGALRPRLPTLCKIVLWWCALFVVGVETKSAVPLFVALDPNFYWLIQGGPRLQRHVRRA